MRSNIDYESKVHGSAATTQLDKLDNIQHQAGALKTPPTAARDRRNASRDKKNTTNKLLN